MVAQCANILEKEEPKIEELLVKFKIPYSFLRRQLKGTSADE